jgi:hypothetical protein
LVIVPEEPFSIQINILKPDLEGPESWKKGDRRPRMAEEEA